MRFVLGTTQTAPSTTKPQLLFFYDAREGTSRRCEGYLAQVLQRRRNHESFLVDRIDVNKRADLCERFRVTATPTIVVIAEGKVRARLTSPKGSAAIREQLEPWLR